MNLKVVVVLFAGMALFSSCEYQRYNKAEQADVRAGNQWVYGVSPDSAARQLANKYTEKPELEGKANELRTKLYGDSEVYLK